jgi:excisionase family DNA binding protein
LIAYLTVAEAAELARVSPKRLRALMSDGTLQEGVHYTRPRGLRPRFKRDALLAWLDGGDQGSNRPPVTNRRRRQRGKLDLSPLSGLNARSDGL